MTEEVRGVVGRQRVGRGTKSDHDAVVLMTDDGPLRLRRAGGNPFADPDLEALVGCQLLVRGMRHGTLFILNEWEVLDPPP